MSTNARRDENSVPVLLAVSSADGETIVEVWADPVTHRLLTQNVGASVTQIVAGTNVTISPIGGTGIVTINATGGGSAPVGGLNAIQVYGTSTTLNGDNTKATVDPATGNSFFAGQLHTTHNTLDDGSGNTTISGTISTDAGSIYSNGLGYLNVNILTSSLGIINIGTYTDDLSSTGSSGMYLQSTGTGTAWTTPPFQATLVSGTNIKTVNGTTLLGSGDVGTINIAHGGTGLTTLGTGYIPFGAGTSALGGSANATLDASGNITLAGNGYFSGNVGIGTLTPNDKLVVHGGSINFDSVTAPSTSATAALAGAGAGNVDNGTHYYFISYVTKTGQTNTYAASNAVVVSDNTTNGKVSLTGIPVSTDPSVIARNIFRSPSTNSGWTYYLATISDNTTTTYTDNTSDATMIANGYYINRSSNNFQTAALWNTSAGGLTVDGNALLSLAGIHDSIYIGIGAGSVNAAKTYENIGIGSGVLSASNFSGTSNVVIGHNSTQAITTGKNNTVLNDGALNSNTTGDDNTAIGRNVFAHSTTGASNQGIGTNAGYNIVSGASNITIGVNSLFTNVSGSNNIALGSFSLYNTTGSGNTVVGYATLYSASSGSNNSALGIWAGRNTTTGSSNIVIGAYVDLPSTTSNQQLNIGNLIYGTGVYGGTTQSSTPTGGKVGINVSAPTSNLDLAASTTTQASLRILSGTAPTSPNDGDIWYNGTNIYIRVGGTTKTFTIV
jgi:hypothetical protein